MCRERFGIVYRKVHNEPARRVPFDPPLRRKLRARHGYLVGTAAAYYNGGISGKRAFRRGFELAGYVRQSSRKRSRARRFIQRGFRRRFGYIAFFEFRDG